MGGERRGQESARQDGKRLRQIRRLHLLSEPLDAATLKLADRLANVRECKRTGDSRLDMYRREQPKLREALAGLGDQRLWDALNEALT